MEATKTTNKNFYEVELTPIASFNPTTGERLAKPFIQTFTKAEYELLKVYHKAAGYALIKVISEPE